MGSADVGRSNAAAVVKTAHNERDGQFSPDGKWVAYESDESGRPEIYTQPFPGPGRKVRISVEGGTQVRWRHNGKELFYIAPDERLMAVAIDPSLSAAGVENQCRSSRRTLPPSGRFRGNSTSYMQTVNVS